MIPSRFYRTLRFVFGIAFGAALSAPSAQALPYYFEFGATMATWTNPDPIFQAAGYTSATTASGSYGVPMTIGLQLQDRVKGLLFSVALQNRYLGGQTGAGQPFTVMTTGPLFRVEFWRFVLGAGYTTFVSNGLSFQQADGVSSAMTLEGQFLFPITPEIDFGLQASQVTFSASGESSVIEYGAYFRLNFGFSDSAKKERGKYKGWRYPFGSPLR
jgi:hypothetical protein